MSNTPHAMLRIRKLEFPSHIGWTEEERATAQMIRVNVTLKFLTPPKACETDELTDTICYHKMAEQITKLCQTESFCLIEHLADYVYQGVKNLVDPSIKVAVELTKLEPPVEHLARAEFYYGDFDPC
ncbi:MAG: dihydroneopterin aldolase [Gammaproteobacteria bacterium]